VLVRLHAYYVASDPILGDAIWTHIRRRLRISPGTLKSGGRLFVPPLFSMRSAYAAGWLSSLVLSVLRVLRAVRSSAARTAIAAGSSMRSGNPCLSRERRASSAPALQISARSSGLSGRRGGRRTGCLPARLALAFFRPGLAWIMSVVGHHLPETTRRSGHHLRSAARKSGWGRNDTHRAEPGQYHGVIKSLRFALNTGLMAGNCPRDLSLSLLARVCT
jgi:hypothetical protein